MRLEINLVLKCKLVFIDNSDHVVRVGKMHNLSESNVDMDKGFKTVSIWIRYLINEIVFTLVHRNDNPQNLYLYRYNDKKNYKENEITECPI